MFTVPSFEARQDQWEDFSENEHVDAITCPTGNHVDLFDQLPDFTFSVAAYPWIPSHFASAWQDSSRTDIVEWYV